MFLIIPGSKQTAYSGGALSDEAAEETSGAIVAYGMPFTINVHNPVVMTGTLGFALEYTQVPCGSSVTA